MFDSLKLRKRILEVEEELSVVKRQLAGLQTEWLDTLDRLKSMMGRIVKDRQRADAARAAISPTEDGEGNNAAETVESLSARQRTINQQILERRNRLRSN